MKNAFLNIYSKIGILTILILTSVTFHCHATVYTFESVGDYTDASNWDVYPGTDLFSNDTISIEANCWNFNLFAIDGYVVFSEDVSNISIDMLDIWDGCQMEILSNYIQIDINGYFTYNTNNILSLPNYPFIVIFNSNWGIDFYSCPIWDNAIVEYYNYGSQDAFMLECMDGTFFNEGTIDVTSSIVHLNCDLDLGSGTIESQDPFDLIQFNGNIQQYCSSCTATINNINTLYINQNSSINGSVTLNAPD